MDPAKLQNYPLISANPSAIEYFWHQLPYGIPGFITFIVGVILFGLGIYAARKKENRAFYLSFAITCLGYGFLGLVLFLRAVVLDKGVLLDANRLVYFFVMPLAPGSALVFYYILEKRHKLLLYSTWLGWATMGLGLWGILTGQAFTGEWLGYSFGNYPVAGNFLKPWGIVAAVVYLVVFVPITLRTYFEDKEKARKKVFIFIGIHILVLLTISNLPSFIGYAIFPGANFAFIGMGFLAYGVIRTDSPDLFELLYVKNGLYYILNSFVGVVFLGVAVGVAVFLEPAHYESLNWWPWILLPFLSALALFSLGILVGGTNPGNKINQLGSFSLFLTGIYLLAILIQSLGLEPIIAKRLEQLCYLIFAMAPAIQFRFAMLALNKNPVKLKLFFDFSSLILCLLALTPYLFTGYYSFYHGNISRSGPVIQYLGFLGFLATFITLRYWWKMPEKGKNPLGNFVALYSILSTVLLLGTIPATMGLPIYPFGNLVIIPTGLLAFAILRYNALTTNDIALRLSSRISRIVLLLPLLSIIICYPLMQGQSDFANILLHIVLMTSPLILLGYQLTFLYTKPFAQKLDTLIHNLENEKQNAQQAKEEVDNLNQLLGTINEAESLEPILDHTIEFVRNNYGIADYIFVIKNASGTHLEYVKSTLPETLSEGEIEKIQNLSIPLTVKKGVFELVNRRKRVTNFPHVNKGFLSEEEIVLFESTQIKVGVIIPVKIKDEIIGFLGFFKHSGDKISQVIEDKLVILADQVAGVIHSTNLYQEVQKERRKTEKIYAEIALLNQLSRSISESPDIDDIMSQVMAHLKDNYNITHYVLFLVDNEEKRSRIYKLTLEQNFTGEELDFLNNFSVDLRDPESLQHINYKNKKSFYLPRAKKEKLKVEDEQKLLDLYNFNSYLSIPLILANEVVAILAVSSKEDFILQKEERKKIRVLCDQITGVIQNANLLEETRRGRTEIKELNDLLKEINQENNIQAIVAKVNEFTQTQYDLPHCNIFTFNESRSHLRFLSGVFAEDIPEEQVEHIKTQEIPVTGKGGAFGLVTLRKKSIYFPIIKYDRLAEEEQYIADALGITSLFSIPLVIHGEVIALLNFWTTNNEKHKLNREGRTRLLILAEQIAGVIYSKNLLAEIQREREKSEELLLNILPEKVARELKKSGQVEPSYYEDVSIMFTDFKGFTASAAKMQPEKLVKELDAMFMQFDQITERHGIEKLKTIGDAYMCAGGIPEINRTHVLDCCLAALEIQHFMKETSEIRNLVDDEEFWQLRLGIHTGPVMAGVIGRKKFAYDVWGDAVNVASRMESGGEAGRINISEDTFQVAKEFFECEYRGKFPVKNRGEMHMYFLNRLKEEFSKDDGGIVANERFLGLYEGISRGVMVGGQGNPEN